MKRTANAYWEGTGKDGKGHLTTKSKVLEKTQYSFSSRFEEGKGTNPEELIAAAHSGCFTMKLAFNLQEKGFKATSLETTCTINFVNGALESSHLTLTAKVDEIAENEFEDLVKDAEMNCPISKALKIKISVNYTLNK